jgi:hypothetical protein
MENVQSSAVPQAYPDREQAHEVLRQLDADRARLADRLAAPPWLYLLFAVLAAGYVATPAVPSDGGRSTVVGILLAASVLVAAGYHRLSGVRLGRVGPGGAWLLGGALLAVLLLLSTAYGLAASLPPAWVLAPAVAAFAVVLLSGRRFDRLYRENLRRGR